MNEMFWSTDTQNSHSFTMVKPSINAFGRPHFLHTKLILVLRTPFSPTPTLSLDQKLPSPIRRPLRIKSRNKALECC